MTSEQMRIVIAEQCGWKQEPDQYYSDGRAWTFKGKHRCPTCDLPDHLNDLNAIQAEVKKCDLKTLMKFSDYLKAIVEDKLCVRSAVDARYMTLQAPPLWWSEAFIKTVCPDKWTDD